MFLKFNFKEVLKENLKNLENKIYVYTRSACMNSGKRRYLYPPKTFVVAFIICRTQDRKSASLQGSIGDIIQKTFRGLYRGCYSENFPSFPDQLFFRAGGRG